MTADRPGWLPFAARLTLFGTDDQVFDSGRLLALYGVEAESTSTSSVKREAQASASYGAGKINFTLRPGRADIVWEVPFSDDMVMLGALDQVVSLMLGPLNSWIKERSWHRVALGLRAGRQVASHVEGYAEVAAKLPNLSLDGERCSDFVFQINRFKDVQVDGRNFRVNRLAKWAVIRFETAQLTGDLALGRFLESEVLQSVLVASVELDMNTAPEMKEPLSGEQALK